VSQIRENLMFVARGGHSREDVNTKTMVTGEERRFEY